jgi:hypothetical protein
VNLSLKVARMPVVHRGTGFHTRGLEIARMKSLKAFSAGIFFALEKMPVGLTTEPPCRPSLPILRYSCATLAKENAA